MSFDEQILSEIVRQRLRLPSQIPVLWAIPEAIEQLSRKIAANPRKRPLLLSHREDAQIELGADGAINLLDLEDAGLLREYLHHGTIWLTSAGGITHPYSLVRINSPMIVMQRPTFGADYYHYWLEGDHLRVLNLTANLPEQASGTLSFVCPRRMTIFDAAEKPELAELLVAKTIEVITSAGASADSAADGEK